MEQSINIPIGDPIPHPFEGPEAYCPACGEPQVKGVIRHSYDCPFHGDDLSPEEGNY